jgi:Ribbon-helix-helix protein, copG family
MGLYRKILPCIIGFRCTERDAETLAHLAQVSGLDKSAVLRALVRQVRVEALQLSACPDPEEATATRT